MRTPTWLEENPLIMTGSWDNTPIFRIRRGVDTAAAHEAYRRRYSRETVAAMQKLGVTLTVTDFMKAFGLAAEREFAEGLKDYVAACHESGIRVGAYVGSTLAYETMLVERPESEEWLVKDPAGGYLHYPGQSFRARVYFMHPGYRSYIKEVLTAAIRDFGADEIHFDSASVMAETVLFYHPRAIVDFRDYLGSEYRPEQLKDRLGFADASAVLPPRGTLDPIDDPLFQEWADFRCQMLADYFGEMKAHIRELNPEAAVSVNTLEGIGADNMEWRVGVDHARILPQTDILWNEEQDIAGVHGGILVSRIRSYKMTARAGRRMLTYTGGGGQHKLQLAESMAYNLGTLGMLGDPLDALDFPADQLPYVEFFRRNFDCYRGVESVADVAVLHSFRTMAFNSGRPRRSSLLFQQALIQGKILFDIVFDSGLEDLSRYRVLALPDQEILDERQMDLIRAFVAGGGGLVATEFTSFYDKKRHRRAAFGLADLFGNLPVPGHDGLTDHVLAIPEVRRTAIAGRVVYLPEVIDVGGAVHYPLPANFTEILAALRWAARGELTLEVDAPLTVTTELTRSEDGNLLFLHLLNYSAVMPVEEIGIRLRTPGGRPVAAADLHTPASPAARPLTSAGSGPVVEWVLPGLETYALIAVTLA